MQFGDYSVDNIGSFRLHFSVKDLLEALDIPFVFAEWLNNILESGGLDTSTAVLVQEAKKHFWCWVNLSHEDNVTMQISQEDSSCKKLRISNPFNRWEKKVKKGSEAVFQQFCFMLCLLLEIGNYSLSGEDEERIYNFLIEQGVTEQDKLRLVIIDKDKTGIFYGDELVAEMPRSNPQNCEAIRLIYGASHPDTGYLGITNEGRIYNRSAFQIPAIEKKAVKVCINQGAYAILLEDGKIIHNLKYSLLPEAPVKNIELKGEQLIWKRME